MHKTSNYDETDALLRLEDVLRILQISKSTWWAGIRNGCFPKPVKLGERMSRWRRSEIMALVQSGVAQDSDTEDSDQSQLQLTIPF
jgi:prophage regulatory protein